MISNRSLALLALLMADKHMKQTAIGDLSTVVFEQDLRTDCLELFNRHFSHGRLHSFGFEPASV